MNTPAYKAKAMSPVKPMSETANHGEYAQTSVQMSGRATTKPSKGSVSAALVDGPFGGKKPA